MQVTSWLTCLWPGLPRLWWRGDWRALLAAIAFGLVLNLWLVATFLWPELLPGKAAKFGGIAILAFWVAAIWRGRKALQEIRIGAGDRAPQDLFIEAQREYLSRHWFEAEQLLVELLATHERDADAHLMLAAVYRHTGRVAEAAERLTKLERLDGAAKWTLEISQERRLLQSRTEEREEDQEAAVAQATVD